ncbi:hypothetical protein IT418_04210 [bacterium]|nr:hypothetical protein [bacterium]
MKSYLAIASITIAIIGYIPYFKDTVTGRTKPHIFSWFTWGLSSLIAFGVQLAGNGGEGSYVNLVMAIICFALVFLGYKNGTKNITKSDRISFILALVATIFWLIIKQPILSIVFVVLIDLFSLFPTVRKSWNNPWQETLSMYVISCIRQILTIFAMSSMTFVTLLYPSYSLLAGFSFCVMLILKRREVSDNRV